MTIPARVIPLLLALAGFGAPLLVGCRATPAEHGEYRFAGGELIDTETVSLEKAFNAAQVAVAALQFRPAGPTKDALQAQVAAETMDHTLVHINMKSIGAGVTEFRIRVGLLGDQGKSRAIMDQIRKSL